MSGSPPARQGNWFVRRWKVLVPLGVVLAAVGAWLFFGWFGLHTLFFDETIDEDLPAFSAAGAAPEPDPVVTTTAPATTAPAAAASTTSTTTTVPETTTTTGPAIRVLASGDFIDRSHPTTGRAIVLGDGSGQRFLRFEDFETDNGPDLNVYLSTAPPDALAGEFDDDFVDLGDLKGNVGDQNYEIPPDVDLDRYSTVVVWCVRFTVAFGSASLDS